MAFVHSDAYGSLMASKLIERRKAESVMARWMRMDYGNQLVSYKGQTIDLPFDKTSAANDAVEVNDAFDDYVETQVAFDSIPLTINHAFKRKLVAGLFDDALDPYSRLEGAAPTRFAAWDKVFDTNVIAEITADRLLDLDGNAVKKFDAGDFGGTPGLAIDVSTGGDATPKELVIALSKLLVPKGINSFHVGFSFLTELKDELGTGFNRIELLGATEVLRNVNGLDVVYNPNIDDYDTEVMTWVQNMDAIYGAVAIRNAYYKDRDEKGNPAIYMDELYGATVNGDNFVQVNYTTGAQVS